jgi:hypothetical protein
MEIKLAKVWKKALWSMLGSRTRKLRYQTEIKLAKVWEWAFRWKDSQTEVPD